jgi:ATP adenylyltransferase/5',5'''-P-1,P-4-tetraphosphate phosphorylase II
MDNMSEMTTAVLIYKQDMNELQTWVKKKKKKKQAFLLQVTEDWTCLLIENDLRVANGLLGVISIFITNK